MKLSFKEIQHKTTHVVVGYVNVTDIVKKLFPEVKEAILHVCQDTVLNKTEFLNKYRDYDLLLKPNLINIADGSLYIKFNNGHIATILYDEKNGAFVSTQPKDSAISKFFSED